MNLSFEKQSKKSDLSRQTLREKNWLRQERTLLKIQREQSPFYLQKNLLQILCFQFWLHLFSWLQLLISGCFDTLLLLFWIIIPTSLARTLKFFFLYFVPHMGRKIIDAVTPWGSLSAWEKNGNCISSEKMLLEWKTKSWSHMFGANVL